MNNDVLIKDENVKVRKVTSEVKGLRITFNEYYRVDLTTGEEVWDRDLEIMNDTVLYDAYKKKKGLLTNAEIKNIRKKYEMNQKEFALVLGVGEVTVNRFENGAIQTEATDAIMRLSENPDNMYNLLLKNKMNIPKASFEKYMNKIKELKSLQEHKLAKLDFVSLKKLSFETVSSNDVANLLIKKYNTVYEKLGKEFKLDINCEYITHLKLQKLLYYVQGLCLCIFGKPAFTSKIYAFKYGPIVDEIYDKYKTSGKNSITTPKRVQELSEGLNEVIDIVLDSYGKLDAYSLINFSHDEEPWKETDINTEIKIEKIKEYFDKVYGD